MKKTFLSLVLLSLGVFAAPAPVNAADLMVSAPMQQCTSNEECALMTNSCKDNCGFVPVNKSSLPALESSYQERCGKPAAENPKCNMNPPIAAACINSRCTIDYAFANHAGAKDYQSGAYPMPADAVPSKVPADAYKNVNDRNGKFTAYDMPQDQIRQNTMGQVKTGTVAIPAPAPATAPSATAPVTPDGRSYATPPTAVPAQTPVAPSSSTSSATAPAPAYVLAPPAPEGMAPSAPTAAPAPAAPTGPVSSKGFTPLAPSAASLEAPITDMPGAAPLNKAVVGAPAVPQSDLSPAPTFVPPAGTAIPVAPEDPGAIPPDAATMVPVLKGDNDSDAMRSFAAKKTKAGSYNQ